MGDDTTKRNLWWFYELNEREQKEVHFAGAYAQHYAHGTDGHSRLMLIAKLVDLLEKSQPDTPQKPVDTSLLTPAEPPKDFDPSKPSNPRKPQSFA